jgi:hypothetical protein
VGAFVAADAVREIPPYFPTAERVEIARSSNDALSESVGAVLAPIVPGEAGGLAWSS